MVELYGAGRGVVAPSEREGRLRRGGGDGVAILSVRGSYLTGRGIGCHGEVMIDTGAPVVAGALAAVQAGDGASVGVAHYSDLGNLVLLSDTRGKHAGAVLCCCADAEPLGPVIGAHHGYVPA